ncbi:MAG: hypothetical protein ACKVQV_13520 [Bacteroidia bacterium]
MKKISMIEKIVLSVCLMLNFNFCVASSLDSLCTINNVKIYLENDDVSIKNIGKLLLIYEADTLVLVTDELLKSIKLDLSFLSEIIFVYQDRILEVKGFEKYLKIGGSYDFQFNINRLTSDCLNIKYYYGNSEFIDSYISTHGIVQCNLLTIKNN